MEKKKKKQSIGRQPQASATYRQVQANRKVHARPKQSGLKIMIRVSGPTELVVSTSPPLAATGPDLMWVVRSFLLLVAVLSAGNVDLGVSGPLSALCVGGWLANAGIRGRGWVSRGRVGMMARGRGRHSLLWSGGAETQGLDIAACRSACPGGFGGSNAAALGVTLVANAMLVEPLAQAVNCVVFLFGRPFVFAMLFLFALFPLALLFALLLFAVGVALLFLLWSALAGAAPWLLVLGGLGRGGAGGCWRAGDGALAIGLLQLLNRVVELLLKLCVLFRELLVLLGERLLFVCKELILVRDGTHMGLVLLNLVAQLTDGGLELGDLFGKLVSLLARLLKSTLQLVDGCVVLVARSQEVAVAVGIGGSTLAVAEGTHTRVAALMLVVPFGGRAPADCSAHGDGSYSVMPLEGGEGCKAKAA